MGRKPLTELNVFIDEQTTMIMKARIEEGFTAADVVKKSVTVWDYLTQAQMNGDKVLIQRGQEVFELKLQ